MEVTMMDEEEYAAADKIFIKLFTSLPKSREEGDERRKELSDYYFNLTGERDSNPNSIMHHRIALYGQLCENCGKPYRTAKASFCAACGHRKN